MTTCAFTLGAKAPVMPRPASASKAVPRVVLIVRRVGGRCIWSPFEAGSLYCVGWCVAFKKVQHCTANVRLIDPKASREPCPPDPFATEGAVIDLALFPHRRLRHYPRLSNMNRRSRRFHPTLRC